jgi:hypothetical protein
MVRTLRWNKTGVMGKSEIENCFVTFIFFIILFDLGVNFYALVR